MSLSHWAHQFLAFSAKCTSLYETDVLRSRSERFLIFALGVPLLSDFQQSARVCTKLRFQPMISMFCHFPTRAPLFTDFQQSARVCTKQRFQLRITLFFSFSHWACNFLAQFSKVYEFVRNSVFNPRSERFVISHWSHHPLAFSAKCTSLYETEVLSPRSERFVIFALGALHFSDFQQSARVCTKQRFHPEIRTFCHFRTGHTTF